MPAALEFISGVSAGSSTLTNVTPNTGDSFTVRSFPVDKAAWLITAGGLFESDGVLEIHSPRMHDNVHGIRSQIIQATADPVHPYEVPTRLFPVDTLTVQSSSSGNAGNPEPVFMLIYYEELPGTSQRMIGCQELRARTANLMGQEVDVAAGTAGDYATAVASNATFDFMKANTDYALVGYTFITASGGVQEACSVHWRGVDTGNLRVGGPAFFNDPFMTDKWFYELSMKTGLPLIPVFNSNNRSGILVDTLTSNTSSNMNISQLFVELTPGPGGPAGGCR